MVQVNHFHRWFTRRKLILRQRELQKRYLRGQGVIL